MAPPILNKYLNIIPNTTYPIVSLPQTISGIAEMLVSYRWYAVVNNDNSNSSEDPRLRDDRSQGVFRVEFCFYLIKTSGRLDDVPWDKFAPVKTRQRLPVRRASDSQMWSPLSVAIAVIDPAGRALVLNSR